MSNLTPASPLRDWLADPVAGQVLRGLLASEGQNEQALAPALGLPLEQLVKMSGGKFPPRLVDTLVTAAETGRVPEWLPTAPPAATGSAVESGLGVEIGAPEPWTEQVTAGRFGGQTVVVTGAASGIGRAVAARIVREEGRVVTVDVSTDGLEALLLHDTASGRPGRDRKEPHHPMTTYRTPRTLASLAAIGLLALTGCGTETGAAQAPNSSPSGEGRGIRATQVAHVTDVHEATGMTLLEGPVLMENGDLYVVDVTAPPGEPKVISVDVATGEHRGVYTDRTGAYTSAQVSPYDGRLYLTDFATGSVVSVERDGSDPRTFFSGEVDGSRMTPDDIAFDDEGNLYVSDSHGTEPGDTGGRIVRIERDGTGTTVLTDGLAHPNGVMFDPEVRGLWISELTEDTVSYLSLDADRTAVTSQHKAIRVDGGLAQTDSIAVDAAGNLYQALHGRPAMAVYSKYGERLATVEVPAKDAGGLRSATNVAIAPGGRAAYMTVSGPDGGYIYGFTALADGIRQSNGG